MSSFFLKMFNDEGSRSEYYRCLAFLLDFLVDDLSDFEECFLELEGGGSAKAASLEESFSCLTELESVSSPLLVPRSAADGSVSPETAATDVIDDLEKSRSFSLNFLFLLLRAVSTLEVDLLALRYRSQPRMMLPQLCVSSK